MQTRLLKICKRRYWN